MKAVPLNRYLIFFSIALSGIAADLATKSWVFGWLGLPGGETYWLWKDVFGLQTSLNPGALFGFGEGWVHWFAVLSVVAVLAIVVWLFVAGAARDLLLTIALGCVMAGVCGNLYDRLGLPGLTDGGGPVYKVRDWILMVIFGYDWPNFNIADSLLVTGAGLVILHAFIFDVCKTPVRATQAATGERPKEPLKD